MSTVPEVDVPTTHDSTVVCFESHLIGRLGLPPNKFLVAIMNFLGCELVHFNPNDIVALSYFSMPCECWLGIPLDTSLFWYFYSPARYNKAVYFRNGLSLRHHRNQEYIDATIKSCWRGLLINENQREPKMTPRLTTLVKRVAKLHNTGLWACH
jgi:hypothetical protein